MKKFFLTSIAIFLCFSGSLQAWSMPGFDKLPWSMQWTSKVVVGAVCFIPKQVMVQFSEVKQLQDMIKEVDQQKAKVHDLDNDIQQSTKEQEKFQAQTTATIGAHNQRIEAASRDLEAARADATSKIEENHQQVAAQLAERQRKAGKELDKLNGRFNGFEKTQQVQYKELQKTIDESNQEKKRQLFGLREDFTQDFSQLRATLNQLQGKASQCENEQKSVLEKFAQVEFVFGKLKNRQEKQQSSLPEIRAAGSLLRKTMGSNTQKQSTMVPVSLQSRIEDVD